MRRKSKRTKGIEPTHPFSSLRQVNSHAAGVDIGAIEIVACVAGEENTQIVKAFGNYPVDLQALAQWMKDHQVKTVAMESTGIYWIPLFEELEGQGFECLLISSRSLRRVAGRKSDIRDAQWIQTLHSYGLLEGSFRPQAELVALRTMLRHRSQAVSDITAVTGQTIIRSILAGMRDPQTLASMREAGCKKSEEEIGKALTGTWHEEHLFILEQSVALYDFYTQPIHACDEEIERLYGMTRPDWEAGEVQALSWRKRNSHSKNIPHNSEAILINNTFATKFLSIMSEQEESHCAFHERVTYLNPR